MYNRSINSSDMDLKRKNINAFKILEMKSQQSAYLAKTGATPSIENSISIMRLNGERVPTSMFKDASLELFKQENRFIRKDSSELPKASGVLQCLTSDMPHFAAPLEKQRVDALLQPDHSTTTKWAKMKSQRDLRHKREEKNSARHKMLQLLHRTIITTDRLNLEQSMKKVAEEKAFVSGLRHDRTKQLEEESTWRKNLAVHEEYIRKEISAKALRRALQSSVELSRSSLLEEKQMKVLQRSASTAKVARLSEETSTQVEIPQVLLDRVKSATRLSDYTKAKEAAKQALEAELSNRIAKYTRSRQQAILRASQLGAPVSLQTISGDSHFYDGLDAFAASSTLSRLTDTVDEPQGFLDVELAISNYASMASQHGEDDYDLDLRSHTSAHSADESWRTDPRAMSQGAYNTLPAMNQN